MNLDELERLHSEATGGTWNALLHSWHTALITDDDNAKLYRNEIAPQIRQTADAHYIAALHNAFPALLALARDGERHRMARTLFSVEDVETALRDSKNFVALEEENLKYDAAIDAAMKERT